ncbi:MAG: hypothetical protein NTW26_01230 [bacterium]|nr:hypothetical protein [bacterium]
MAKERCSWFEDKESRFLTGPHQSEESLCKRHQKGYNPAIKEQAECGKEEGHTC